MRSFLILIITGLAMNAMAQTNYICGPMIFDSQAGEYIADFDENVLNLSYIGEGSMTDAEKDINDGAAIYELRSIPSVGIAVIKEISSARMLYADVQESFYFLLDGKALQLDIYESGGELSSLTNANDNEIRKYDCKVSGQ